jgi:predicted dehydrogenase
VHLSALRQLGVPIVGVAGSTPGRSLDVAGQWGLGRGYASAQELIDDPEVDVVHITSPNDLHFEQARAALRAGKHVVCEKPLAMTSNETAELTELARASGLVAAVNFNLRFYPLVQEMRERVRSGTAGTPYLLTGSYLQDWLLKPTDWNWRVEDSRGGALRVVGDIGSHWFDLAEFIMGSPITELVSDLTTFVPIRRRPTREVATFDSGSSNETTDYRVTSEDAGSVLLRFANGARGAFSVSQVSAGRKNAASLELNGSAESLAWNSERPDELWIGHRDEPNQQLVAGAPLLSPDAAGTRRLPAGHAEGFRDTFVAMYADVYADVALGTISREARYARFADGHRESLLIEAVGASARSGTWISVPQTMEGNQ